MLNRASDNRNMHVPHFPSMCLFTTSLHPEPAPGITPTHVHVRFGLDHTFNESSKKLPGDEQVLEIPIQPDVTSLETAEYKLHQAVTRAYVMPAHMCKWFSDRFGFEVRLHYIGLNTRQVLGAINPNAPRVFVGDPDPKIAAAKQIAPNSSNTWLNSIKSGAGSLVNTVASYTGANMTSQVGVEEGLTFADVASFLVVNQKSFEDVKERIGTEIDMDKFRPNIVVEGAEKAWEEDYWGEIAIKTYQQRRPGDDNKENENDELRVMFTSNCVRCASINVDYGTGKMAEGPEGQLLKSMQGYRRVDPGHKYSPVFGRYGFVSMRNGVRPKEGFVVSVGDEVEVTLWNERRTHFCKLSCSLFSSIIYCQADRLLYRDRSGLTDTCDSLAWSRDVIRKDKRNFRIFLQDSTRPDHANDYSSLAANKFHAQVSIQYIMRLEYAVTVLDLCFYLHSV